MHNHKQVNCVSFSAKGLLASASQDASIRLWTAQALKPLYVFDLNKAPIGENCHKMHPYASGRPKHSSLCVYLT